MNGCRFYYCIFNISTRGYIVMLVSKRIPGIIYNHRFAFLTSLCIFLAALYFLFYWRFLCSNWEPRSHLNRLCHLYHAGKVVGTLCRPMCDERTIDTLTCHSFHAGKAAVFSARLEGTTKVVVKLPNYDDSGQDVDELWWTDTAGQQHYPMEEEFVSLIRRHVALKLNTTIGTENARSLSRLVSAGQGYSHTKHRKQEMQAAWRLLQDNEFLLSVVYVERDIFPRVLGTCGSYFASEYLQPAIEGEAAAGLAEDGGRASWSARVRLALSVLELLEVLDQEMLSLCDVKPAHFGFTTSGRLKVLDLDVTLPRTVADAITADHSQCAADPDCDLFDCKSKCNPQTKRCESPVTNDNLQRVCEKVLLGWTVSGRVLVPGLLLSRHTPGALAALLRQCGDNEKGLRERLVVTLTEMDTVLADELDL